MTLRPTGKEPARLDEIAIQARWLRVYNATGTAIARGKAVYINGWNAANTIPTIALAAATALTTCAVGVTLEAIANNGYGYILLEGKLDEIDTSAASAVGAKVYLSATPGAYAFAQPADGNVVQEIGVVEAKHATYGKIRFYPVWHHFLSIPATAINDLDPDALELSLLDGATAGGLTASKAVIRTAQSNITLKTLVVAAAGSGQGDGAALTADVNIITGADNATCVVLPTAVVGHSITVVNTVANKTLPVFPADGAQINGGGANAAFTLGPGQTATFHCSALLTWYTEGQAAATPTVTELGYLAGATPGSQVASKAAVVNADKDLTGLRDVSLRRLFTSVNGAVAGDGVTVVEYGEGTIHQTVFTLTDVEVPITRKVDDSSGFGGLKIYDFMSGMIRVLGAVCDLTCTAGAGIAATGSGDIALGTTITADITLDGTDVDIMASTGMEDPFIASVGDANAAVANATVGGLDGTGTPKDCNLNVIFDAGDVSADTTATFNGTITLTWLSLGDYAPHA